MSRVPLIHTHVCLSLALSLTCRQADGVVVGPRERELALARGSLRRPLLHAWFGARPKVVQTRKMGVLPAQKCSGDALRAYLSGRDVGWYGCTSSARSAIHPP